PYVTENAGVARPWRQPHPQSLEDVRMTRSRRAAKLCRTAMAALAVVAMGAAFAAPAMAQDDAEEPIERAFSTKIGEMALEAEELQDTDPQAALRVINRALEEDVSPYERYVLLNMRAGIYGADNPGAAI